MAMMIAVEKIDHAVEAETAEVTDETKTSEPGPSEIRHSSPRSDDGPLRALPEEAEQPLPSILEAQNPSGFERQQLEAWGEVPTRKGRPKLSPEERILRRRESQLRYYHKKKGTLPQVEQEVVDIEDLAITTLPSPTTDDSPPQSRDEGVPEANSIPKEMHPQNMQRTPLDIRFTPHLRARALLRRDHETRSKRYANLFAGTLLHA